jgi:hypothetical protein
VPRTLAFVLALVLTAAPAGAQIDCSDPDDLCTGDPCVIPEIQPADPCTADFGQRALVVEGLRDVGAVDFTAAGITLAGPVRGREGMGGQLLLRSSGPIIVDAPIEFEDESSVELRATFDDVEVNAPIRLTGGDDTPLDSGLIVTGDRVTLDAPIKNLGGTDQIVIQASTISIQARITSRREGSGTPPPLAMAAEGVISINGPLSIDGAIDVASDFEIDVRRPIRMAGDHLSLFVDMGELNVEAPIKSTGRANGSRCGAIRINSSRGPPVIDAPVVCAGREGGDGITLRGTGVRVNDIVKTVSKDADGGDIVLEAPNGGDIVVTGSIVARGSQPGDVLVSGDNVRFEDASVKSSAQPGGGAQRFTAAAGDVSLEGTFVATKRGTIQATATGNVTTEGTFGVGAGGCIGLSAGGTVTTGSSVFDQPVIQSCP